MKVKVINRFRDKHTNLLHEINEELEITDKRYKEINSTSYGVFVEEINEEKKPPKGIGTHPDTTLTSKPNTTKSNKSTNKK